MNKKNHIKKSDSDFQNFIEYRKGLSLLDKKLETAKLIYQIDLVDVVKAYQTVSRKINREIKVYKIFSKLTPIAAILTLPLLVFSVWSFFFHENYRKTTVEITQNEISWQEIDNPVGIRSHVVLPDGTNLWLNAGSHLRYGIPFIRENREVELSGEAFLVVEKNEQSPFVVKVGNTKVEVVGTQFNVNAWPGMEKIQVALKEGKVKFWFSDNVTMKYCEIQPNDLLEFHIKDKTVTRENTNIEKYIAWHQNIMILDETPITELARLLEQWYGVQVVIGCEEIKRYRFTTIFDNEPLHRVLELLEISSPGIKIKYTMGTPIEGSKKISPSVVTITKKSMPMRN